MTMIPVKLRSGRRCSRCGRSKTAWLDDYGNSICTDCKCRLQDNIRKEVKYEVGY